MSELRVDAALGGPYERLGAILQRGGEEDCSGSRRCYVRLLLDNQYERFNAYCRLTREEFDELAAAFSQ